MVRLGAGGEHVFVQGVSDGPCGSGFLVVTGAVKRCLDLGAECGAAASSMENNPAWRSRLLY